MRKAKFLLVICVLLIAVAASACTSSGTGYSFTNPPDTNTDWRYVEGDEGMVVDAKFNETEYDAVTPYIFTPTDATEDYKVSMWTHFGEKGFYIKTLVEDPKVFYNTERPIYENTSIIFYMAPYEGLATKLSYNTLQARIGVNGKTDQWFADLKYNLEYPYTCGYFDTMSAVDIRNGNKSIKYDKMGTVELRDVTGYNVETYVPYTSMGLDAKPDMLFISPEINCLIDYSAGRTMYMATGSVFNDPSTFKIFTPDGYVNEVPITHKDTTKKIDGEMDDWTTDEKTNGITMRGTGTASERGFDVYAKYEKGDGIYFVGEAKHNTNPTGQPVNADHWWKNTNVEFQVDSVQRYLQAAGSKGHMLSFFKTTGSANNYTTKFEVFIPEDAIGDRNDLVNYVRFGIAFKVLDEAITIEGRGTPTDWWFVNGHNPGISTERYYLTEDGVFEEPQLGFTLEKTIDGDLADWATDIADMETSGNYSSAFGSGTFSEQGFKAYAKYVKGKGLYLAGEAKHKTNPSVEGNWWLSTNVELSVRADGIPHSDTNPTTQYWLNNRSNKSGGIYAAAFVTTGTANNFTTKFELFILTADIRGATLEDEFVRVGIAFKAVGEKIEFDGRNTATDTDLDWWYGIDKVGENYILRTPKGNNIFYAYSDGLFGAKKAA